MSLYLPILFFSFAQASEGNTPSLAGLSNIFNWAIGIGAILALGKIIYSGIMYTISAGNESKQKEAIDGIKDAAIGFIFLLGAYILLQTIDPRVLSPRVQIPDLPTLQPRPTPITQQPRFAPITLQPRPTQITQQPRTISKPESIAERTIVRDCINCSEIDKSLDIKKEGRGTCYLSEEIHFCYINSELNSKLISLNAKINSEGKYRWRITEAWPPTVPHSHPCHQNGSCVDANFIGGYPRPASDIRDFIIKSKEAGLRSVFEVENDARRQTLLGQGVPAINIIVADITAEHFSVYMIN